ncbi:MAG TPA: hypothetical protein VF407_19025 [Polyangiaceae bacterium]
MIFGAMLTTSVALFAGAGACGGDDDATSDPDHDASTTDALPTSDVVDAAPYEASIPIGTTCVVPGSSDLPGVAAFRAHQNRCAAVDIDGFIASCLEGDGGTCDAFVASRPDCAACFLGPSGFADAATPDAASTWPVLDFVSSVAVAVNVDGCLAAAADAGDDCALAASKRAYCVGTACGECDDFVACSTYETTFDAAGTCVAVPVSPACLDAVDAAATSRNPACIPADGGFYEYARLTGLEICGP